MWESTMDEQKLRDDLLSVTRKVDERGWAPGSSGNTSVRIPGTDTFLIKATNQSMAWAEPRSILKIDSGRTILSGEGKPSKEVGFHLGVYSKRSDVGGIIHAHPPYATSYAIAGIVFPLVTGPSKIYLKRIPIVEVAPGGSPELAKMVTDAFADESIKVVLMKGHGLVAAGKTIFDAFSYVDWAEDAARAAIITGQISAMSKS
jgi:L-ribulose-5-phosphate 4-epimerase